MNKFLAYSLANLKKIYLERRYLKDTSFLKLLTFFQARFPLFIFIFTSLLSLSFPQLTHARDTLASISRLQGRCEDLIRECLSFDISKRLDCFSDTVSISSCINSPFINVLKLRSGKCVDTDSKQQETYSKITFGNVLDQRVLDQHCAATFDTQLAAVLITYFTAKDYRPGRSQNKDSDELLEMQNLKINELLDYIKQCWVMATGKVSEDGTSL